MVNNSFSQFIEELRIARNLSRDDFLDDIISKRQYQRFLNGESSIKNDVMTKLLTKLEVNSLDIYYQTIINSEQHSRDLRKAHEEYIAFNYQEAYKILESINIDEVKSTFDVKSYTYLKTVLDIHFKKLPESTGIEKLSDLINYPDILNSQMINYLEINTLLFISDFMIKNKNDHSIPNFLYKIFKDEAYIYNQINPFYRPILYSNLSRALGIVKEYKKSVKIANLGIQLCEKYQILAGLEHLLYYKAVGLRYTNAHEIKIKDTLARLKHTLEIFNNQAKKEYFITAIEKSFNIKYNEL